MQTSHAKPQTRLTRKALAAGLAIAFGLSGANAMAAGPSVSAPAFTHEGGLTGMETLSASRADPAALSTMVEPDLDLDVVEGVNSGDDADISAQWQAMNRARAKLEAELFPEGRAPTATHTVTNCNDDGPGSLRQKISGAASGDTVDLSTLTCSTITLSGPLIFDQADLSLLGLEQDSPLNLIMLTPAAGNQAGLIYHMGDGTLAVQNLQLVGGKKYGTGGTVQGACISSSGFVAFTSSAAKYCTAKNSGVGLTEGGAIFGEQGVAVISSLVTGNKSLANNGDAHGGGIFTLGDFTSKYSTIRSNEAASTLAFANGGGVYAHKSTSISRSTISSNKASVIAGIIVKSATADNVSITHSTISGNKSSGGGSAGGVFITTSGLVTIANSTFTRNEAVAEAGAGLTIAGAPTLSLNSNIISGNLYRAGTTLYPRDFRSSVMSTGSGNLVGVWPALFAPPSDTIKQIATPLGSLDWNGGPTMTIAPQTGSWAMNRGHFTPTMFDPDKDQRGLPRRVGAGVDIGAMESDALFVDGFNKPPLH